MRPDAPQREGTDVAVVADHSELSPALPGAAGPEGHPEGGLRAGRQVQACWPEDEIAASQVRDALEVVREALVEPRAAVGGRGARRLRCGRELEDAPAAPVGDPQAHGAPVPQQARPAVEIPQQRERWRPPAALQGNREHSDVRGDVERVVKVRQGVRGEADPHGALQPRRNLADLRLWERHRDHCGAQGPRGTVVPGVWCVQEQRRDGGGVEVCAGATQGWRRG